MTQTGKVPVLEIASALFSAARAGILLEEETQAMHNRLELIIITRSRKDERRVWHTLEKCDKYNIPPFNQTTIQPTG